MNKNSYCDPTLEDFPANLYEGEIRFQLSSVCCSSGTYRETDGIVCLNCGEQCLVKEDIIIE